jgi:hypothetical protein
MILDFPSGSIGGKITEGEKEDNLLIADVS